MTKYHAIGGCGDGPTVSRPEFLRLRTDQICPECYLLVPRPRVCFDLRGAGTQQWLYIAVLCDNAAVALAPVDIEALVDFLREHNLGGLAAESPVVCGDSVLILNDIGAVWKVESLCPPAMAKIIRDGARMILPRELLVVAPVDWREPPPIPFGSIPNGASFEAWRAKRDYDAADPEYQRALANHDAELRRWHQAHLLPLLRNLTSAQQKRAQWPAPQPLTTGEPK